MGILLGWGWAALQSKVEQLFSAAAATGSTRQRWATYPGHGGILPRHRGRKEGRLTSASIARAQHLFMSATFVFMSATLVHERMTPALLLIILNNTSAQHLLIRGHEEEAE
ncbi:hypothetical protein DFH09DRAFT_1097113 [Mycena vulgaris]|nr:hypothetical protein DFH09DRAFT_1097113 [Mycena vulgaris]